jgi:hypothetical protein
MYREPAEPIARTSWYSFDCLQHFDTRYRNFSPCFHY